MEINLELDGALAIIEIEDIEYTPKYLGSSDEPPEPAMVDFTFRVTGLHVNGVILELTHEQSQDMTDSLGQYDIEYLEDYVLESYND